MQKLKPLAFETVLKCTECPQAPYAAALVSSPTKFLSLSLLLVGQQEAAKTEELASAKS